MALFHHSSPGHERGRSARHSAAGRPALAPVQVGVYLHSSRALYRVEAVNGERALIEDCRSEELLDVPLTELRGLEPVRVSAD